MPGRDPRPAAEAVLTMKPSLSCSSMCGRNVRMPWITPRRLMSITRSQSCRETSQIGSSEELTPALLQSTWTAPNSSSTRRASSST